MLNFYKKFDEASLLHPIVKELPPFLIRKKSEAILPVITWLSNFFLIYKINCLRNTPHPIKIHEKFTSKIHTKWPKL